MEYQANQEDVLKAKRIYDEIIFTQVLNPFRVKEAFKLIFGYDAQTAQQAKIKVSAYFQYTYKAKDSTETAEIQTPSIVGESSHSEDYAVYDNQEQLDADKASTTATFEYSKVKSAEVSKPKRKRINKKS